jgi:ABC-type transport system involved in multi-copper enzyme maturation permease subunit
MTFLALLTKELRLRLRRERTIWTIVIYISLMGLLGWFFISRYGNINGGYGSPGLSQTGLYLYYLLSMVQLFLILFITPAFTATAVNSEKERQTFDLLLCSRLSSFSLISGKLVAGLVNSLLLIAASVPLFSLVFFFGGVSPEQLLLGLLIYIVTTFMVGTFGMLCSAFIKRPAASTAVTYLGEVLWIVLPLLIALILSITGGGQNIQYLFAWNPVYALISTYPVGAGVSYHLGNATVTIWVTYTILSLAAAILFFLLSMLTVKPMSTYRSPRSSSRPSTTKGQVTA